MLMTRRGSDALRITWKERVDLLVTEVLVPDMTGAELITRVKRQGNVDRFVAMFGAACDARQQPTLAGVSLLRKPLTPEGLLACICRAMSAERSGDQRRTDYGTAFTVC